MTKAHNPATPKFARDIATYTAADFRAEREAAGLSQAYIAGVLGLRPEQISRWERGTIRIPRMAWFGLWYATGRLVEPIQAPKRWMGPKEAAELLEVSDSTMRRWIDEGMVRGFRTRGGHRKVSVDDVEELLAHSAKDLRRDSAPAFLLARPG